MRILDKLFYNTGEEEVYGVKRKTKELNVGKTMFVVFLLFFIPVTMMWSAPLRTVEQNHVALQYNSLTRSVNTQDIYREGLHYVGFFGDFYTYPINIQRFEFVDGDQLITVRSTDGLELKIRGWVQYRIQSNRIGELFREYGTFDQLQMSLFSPTRSAVNNLISREEADHIFQFRDQLGSKFEAELTKFYTDYYVDVINADFRSINFPDEYEIAQENKLIAEQLIETAVFDLETHRIEAQQAVVISEGVANSTIVRADGEALAAYAVREQMDMSNAEYLQWLYLQQLAKLNNPQIVIVTGDEVPEFLIPLAEGPQ